MTDWHHNTFVKYTFSFHKPKALMEITDQRHVPAVLPLGEEPSELIGPEVGRVPERVGRGRRKLNIRIGRNSNTALPILQPTAQFTVLSRVHKTEVSQLHFDT